jgi:hypothetical protein
MDDETPAALRHVVPPIACDPVPGDGGVPLGLAPELVVFYAVGDWVADGDLPAAVRAFLSAFTADDPVALVVRTTGPAATALGDATAAQPGVTPTMLEVARLVGQHPRPAHVQLEPHEWEPARLAGLHCRGDCFISSPSVEWGPHALDAAAYGNPVVPSSDPDRLREVVADLDAARQRAAPIRARVLDDHRASGVLAALREQVPELGLPDVPSPAVATREMIPRIVHFVFGLREEPEPFHLVHELAIRSCLEVVAPDEVHLHCHHLPFGPEWERVAPHVTIHRIEPVDAVGGFRYPDPHVARYSYAHHADFVRLDVLAEHGGVYADLDTLFVAPIPDDLWRRPFVIGREADALDGRCPTPRPALSNALLMSTADSRFLAAWRLEIGEAFDGSWAKHSCFLADDLARRMAADVHVERQLTFHAFEPTIAGLALLLEHPPPDLDGVVSMHLAAHLWWSEHRVDFSPVHAGMIDEEWIRSSPSTYGTFARRFLPDERDAS